MPKPKHHTDWLLIIVEVIAVAVATYFAGPVAGMMLGSAVGALATTVTAAALGAVMAGIADLEMQGLLVGLGLEQRISWESVIRATVSGAVAGGFGGYSEWEFLNQNPALAGQFTVATQQQNLMQSMLRAGISNISQQLTELSLGNTHHFDMGSLLMSVGNVWISSGFKVVQKSVPFLPESIMDDINTVTTGFLTSTLRQESFNIEAIAANIIGSHIGSSIGQAGAAMLRSTSLYREIQQENLLRQINAQKEAQQNATEPTTIEKHAEQLNAGSIKRTQALKAQAAAEKARKEAESKAAWDANVRKQYPSWSDQAAGQGWFTEGDFEINWNSNTPSKQNAKTTYATPATSNSLLEFNSSLVNTGNFYSGFLKSEANNLLSLAEFTINFNLKTMLINAGLKAFGYEFRMPSFQASLPQFSLYPSEANGVLGANVFDVVSILGGGASMLKTGVKYIPSMVKSAEALDVFGIFGRAKASAIAGQEVESVPDIKTGFGKLESKTINISQKGLSIIENHLSKYPEKYNDAMLVRLLAALNEGNTLSGADASFYIHEIAESTQMSKYGLSYDVAHKASIEKYEVSPYSLYHPDVIQHHPELYNNEWHRFWNLEKSNINNTGNF